MVGEQGLLQDWLCGSQDYSSGSEQGRRGKEQKSIEGHNTIFKESSNIALLVKAVIESFAN